MSFLVAAFSPLIGEKPFAPSFGELFFFFSAVSPQTGDEGFLDFGVKYEKRVAMFISLRSNSQVNNFPAFLMLMLRMFNSISTRS